MREIIEIEIIAVIAKEKTYGKNKTCYPFICDVSINGEPSVEAKVVTFDFGIARAIGSGKKYEGTQNEYKGEVNYVLNKELGASRPSVNPSSRHDKAESGADARSTPSTSSEEPKHSNLQQLSFSRSYAKDVVVAVLAKKELETDQIILLWNTLSDANVSWFERYTKSPHPETAPWGNVIIKERLVEEVKKKKLEATFLRELWGKSMYDELRFIDELRNVLSGEGLPF